MDASATRQRTGVVLAGGRGSRMGAFKPLLSFYGRPLLAYAIDAISPICDELLVMAGPHAAAVSRVAGGARVFADPGAGPHVALRLAARLARHPTLVVAPADAPFLRAQTYAPLLAVGGNANYVRDGFADPMVGVYDRDAVRAFDGRSLQTLAATRVPADDRAGELRDLDTPDDLRPYQSYKS